MNLLLVRLMNEFPFAFAGVRVGFFSSFSSIKGLNDDEEYELLPKTGIREDTELVCKYRGEYEVGIDPKQVLIVVIPFVTLILSMIGFDRSAYETLEELKGRVGESVPPEHMGFIKGYEKMLYAEKDPRTDELRGAELAYRYLLGLLKEKKGKRYIFYRLRL